MRITTKILIAIFVIAASFIFASCGDEVINSETKIITVKAKEGFSVVKEYDSTTYLDLDSIVKGEAYVIEGVDENDEINLDITDTELESVDTGNTNLILYYSGLIGEDADKYELNEGQLKISVTITPKNLTEDMLLFKKEISVDEKPFYPFEDLLSYKTGGIERIKSTDYTVQYYSDSSMQNEIFPPFEGDSIYYKIIADGNYMGELSGNFSFVKNSITDLYFEYNNEIYTREKMYSLAGRSYDLNNWKIKSYSVSDLNFTWKITDENNNITVLDMKEQSCILFPDIGNYVISAEIDEDSNYEGSFILPVSVYDQSYVNDFNELLQFNAQESIDLVSGGLESELVDDNSASDGKALRLKFSTNSTQSNPLIIDALELFELSDIFNVNIYYRTTSPLASSWARIWINRNEYVNANLSVSNPNVSVAQDNYVKVSIRHSILLSNKGNSDYLNSLLFGFTDINRTAEIYIDKIELVLNSEKTFNQYDENIGGYIIADYDDTDYNYFAHKTVSTTETFLTAAEASAETETTFDTGVLKVSFGKTWQSGGLLAYLNRSIDISECGSICMKVYSTSAVTLGFYFNDSIYLGQSVNVGWNTIEFTAEQLEAKGISGEISVLNFISSANTVAYYSSIYYTKAL